jgi:SAM-dependent methyltransferase
LDKQEREREFHNRTFADDSRRSVGGVYSIVRYARRRFEDGVLASCAGKDVLEYGCGQGTYSFALAARGARVTGIDISDVAIEQAQARASREQLPITYARMDCENLTFPSASFDLVCGVAILHHLDLDKAFSNLARVMRPGARAVFMEPLGHNPAINLFRRMTPALRTEDEHPLLMRDLRLADRYFGGVRVDYFNLMTLLAVPLRNTRALNPALAVLNAADRALFAIPPVRRMAWQAVLELSLPRARPVVA